MWVGRVWSIIPSTTVDANRHWNRNKPNAIVLIHTIQGGYTEVMAYAEKLGRNVRLFVENDKIGIRPTTIEGHHGPGEPKTVQLLLFKSHYWLLL